MPVQASKATPGEAIRSPTHAATSHGRCLSATEEIRHQCCELFTLDPVVCTRSVQSRVLLLRFTSAVVPLAAAEAG